MKAQLSTGPTSKLARWVMACVGFLFLLGAINKMAEPLSAMGHMPVSFARPLQLVIVLTLELFIGLPWSCSPATGQSGLQSSCSPHSARTCCCRCMPARSPADASTR